MRDRTMPAIGGRQHHRISFNTLKSLLINHLSTVYPHYVSKNTIMSFSTRFSMEDEIFAVTAIAELRPPTWLAEEGTEIVLEDNFLVTCSETSYWDALEQMWEYIGGVEENEEEKRSQETCVTTTSSGASGIAGGLVGAGAYAFW